MTYAYHRMFRILPTYRWWKPLLAALLGLVLYLVMSVFIWQLGLLETVRAIGGNAAATDLAKAVSKDQQNASNPLVMLYTLGSLATMLPAVVLAVRITGLGSFGRLMSVRGRVRWRWLARCILPGVVYMVLQIGLGALVPASWQGAASSEQAASTPPLALAASIVIIVLLVPFQAAGEEFAFRGFGMQALGSWVRWPVVAILVPTVGFAFAHAYNPWGKLDVAVLGVAFAYLTWRTGGLEAGVVAHVVNNVVVFVLAAPFVTSTQSDGSPIGAAITLVASGAYVLMVVGLARRHRPERVAPASVVDEPLGVVHRSGPPASGVGGAS
ncbi:CPBP family intramembrane glutamic endopeptidase [Frondihabitans sp. 762G35]|uniref:CPBP family intramembrane glutamic endopeptidase n=1 Tax=Frondihabitans sp. 762G35 TaxID=1446794 RepID=UPI000E7064D1|nr:type II CAAX endopeptidase family protein [Frondihabitans sp. 762G35]